MILRDPNPYPHISGMCKNCAQIYDLLRDGMKCPNCGSINLRWASMNSPRVAEEPKELLSPYPHVLNSRGDACAPTCDACLWIENVLPKIKELERMYALEDTRHG